MQKKSSKGYMIGLMLLILIGSITTFLAGFYTQSLLSLNTLISPTPISSPNATAETESYSSQTNFQPGKHYFSDTIFVINKQAPHQTLIATVSRAEKDSNYLQNTRVSYFDGQNWSRELQDNTTDKATIFSNRIVKKWNIQIDSSRVLKENIAGEINFKNQSISFTTNELQNEMGMRSLAGYTKFQSRGEGTLSMNNQKHDAYVLYSRIYSLNSSDIQFYNQPLGVTTEWLALWSETGDFYHIDKTNVQKKTAIYETHEIALKVDKFNTVSKAFSLNSSRDDDNDPKTFSFVIAAPINESIQTERINVQNKAPAFTYTWQMAQVQGSITTASGERINGFGLSEFIKD